MNKLLDDLSGGDRRSIGKADLVAAQVLRQPGLLNMIIEGFAHDEPVVRTRSADVAEKVSRSKPDLLAPHKKALLDLLSGATEAAIKWHLAQIVPRLDLDPIERARTFEALKRYLSDTSRIVQASALQALVDLTVDDPAHRRIVASQVETMSRNGSPAVKARARKLKLKLLALESARAKVR